MPALSRSAASIRTSVFAELQPHIDRVLARGDRLVPLQIGDTHLLPPAAARYPAHAGQGTEAELYQYGPIPGVTALREAVAATIRALGGDLAEVDARHVLPTTGATHGAHAALRAVLDPGDEVIVPAPYWPLAPGVVRAAGGVPVEVPFTSRLYDDPSLDPAELLAEAATARTRALYLIDPNNPDGKVLTRAQLARIADFAHARDLWVLADEVYADFAYASPHVSIATLPGMRARTLVVRSFSKSHGLAGARVGYLVAPEAALDAARRVATHTVYAVAVPMQRAAAAALRDGGAWIADARAAYLAARDDAWRALEGTGVRTHLAEGGSYLFVDFAPVLRDRPLRELLARGIERGVLVAPGDAFGAGFATWARLCFTGVSRADLADGLARLRAAIADLALPG